MATQYEFTELNALSVGLHHAIAVVKFSRPHKKTKGSGFSLFASITDPSLNGDKISVTFLHDNATRLPTVSDCSLCCHRVNTCSSNICVFSSLDQSSW